MLSGDLLYRVPQEEHKVIVKNYEPFRGNKKDFNYIKRYYELENRTL